MKRMVKNGDLLDVESDGTITVAGKPIGGGGGSNERVLKLVMPRASGTDAYKTQIPLDDETYQKMHDYYYESVVIYYNDGAPLGVFNLLMYTDSSSNVESKKYSAIAGQNPNYRGENQWYGKMDKSLNFVGVRAVASTSGKYAVIEPFQEGRFMSLDKSKFDALYKLADKPTQDGTYVLKATVSGGAVTYTWAVQ